MHPSSGTSFVESLCTDQSFMSEKLYHNQRGLFLEEGQDFEVEIIVPWSDTDHEGSSTTELQGKCRSELTADVSTGSSKAKTTPASDSVRFTLTRTNNNKQIFFDARHRSPLIYIGQEGSRSRLNITRNCFEQLVESLSAFSVLKEHILHIGYREMELEVAPPTPHVRLLSAQEGARRMLHGFEICYGLRFAAPNGRLQGKSWSLRQFVVYNKASPSRRDSPWIFFGLPKVIQHQLETVLLDYPGGRSLKPIEIHLFLLVTVVKMWRPYFIHLTEKIDFYRKKVHLTGTSENSQIGLIDGSTLVVLKSLEDQALDAVLSIQATIKTTSKFRCLIEKLNQAQGEAIDMDHHSSLLIEQVVYDQQEELDMLVNQGTSLLQKIRGTASTVSNFLSLGNGHALKSLALEAKNEAVEMAKLTKSASGDTKAVKALSVITLIYLPLTVVLNFFSTGFVDKTKDGIRVLEQWWLVFAISSPLTFITLLLWTLWASRDRLFRFLIRCTHRSTTEKLTESNSPPSSGKVSERLMV